PLLNQCAPRLVWLRAARLTLIALTPPAGPGAVCASVAPFTPQAPPPHRAERREFDPNSDEWIRIAAPVPGTEEGDLQLARAHLARQEFSAARSAFKQWRKKY